MNHYKFSEDGKDFEILTYSLDDLSKEARQKAIQDHMDFENELGYEHENEDGSMETIYDYLEIDSEEDVQHIIENIELNEYEFDFRGELVGITQYCGKHPLSGKKAIRLGKEEIILTII